MNNAPETENLRLSGTSLAPGLATGTAFIYRDVLEEYLYTSEVKPDQVDSECRRVHSATEEVINDLSKSANRIEHQIGRYQADVFKAHQAMLHDLIQSREIRQEMETNWVNAEVAVNRVFQRWAHRMYEDESTRFIERGDDVADLGRRLLRALLGVDVHPLENTPDHSILVAHHLLPSDAVFFAQRGTLGIITEVGSAGSHCALMVRQMGIPGICNVAKATEKINDGDTVFVDGFRESAIARPGQKIRKRFEKELQAYRAREEEAKKLTHESATTEEGVQVPVMANVAKAADVQLAKDNGADGIGLYRLEALFMLRKTLPTEEELVDEISTTLAPLQDGTAVVRLLDVGSDKDIPYLAFEEEPAPSLGMRGVRVLLAHPQLLQIQLRALLRVSQTRDIQIMVPLVTTAEDIQAVNYALQSEASKLGMDERPPLVAMIETPAAALSVPEIAQYADAISIGSNDLTQHTMATGRENPLVQHYFKDDHPAVLRLIRIAAAEAGNAKVGICGELAGKPNAMAMLLDAGIQFVSVAPPLIPAVKEAVRDPHAWQTDEIEQEEVT